VLSAEADMRPAIIDVVYHIILLLPLLLLLLLLLLQMPWLFHDFGVSDVVVHSVFEKASATTRKT